MSKEKKKSGQKNTQEPLSGARLLLETLVKEGTEVMFGIPGGVMLPIFDQLYQMDLRFILCRHEQGAAHAADGYARATGNVGVVMATSGPGATNLVTGLATAYMDSIPVVAVTGQVKTNLIGNDAFQEADVTGITRPITKHNALVRDVRDLPRLVREAFHIARTGRPGPVLLDIPVDVSVAEVSEDLDDTPQLPGYKPQNAGHLRQIRMAAEAINQSKRPVIYAGGGVILSGAADELRALAHKANVPVTSTLLALGAFPNDDPLSLQMLGMHGTAYANYAVQECDCLIAIGSRFDDRVTGKVETFAPHAKIVHIDIDPSSIAKNVTVDVPVVGDARKICKKITDLLEHQDRSEWLEQIAEWKRKFPLRYDNDGNDIKPQYVIEQISELTKGDAVICTGVGQHQMWAAQFFGWKFPRQIVTSGGLGTMGYGFPASMGAAVGRPDLPVFDIDGDGSFTMTCAELATAVKNKLPIKVCIMNNTYLGMVRQWQEMFYGRRYSSVENPNPDFPALARAFGAEGISVTKKQDVRSALEKALAITDRPCVLDFHVAQEENVFPMVAAGKSLHEMNLGTLA